jgi:hypothetical protein
LSRAEDVGEIVFDIIQTQTPLLASELRYFLNDTPLVPVLEAVASAMFVKHPSQVIGPNTEDVHCESRPQP